MQFNSKPIIPNRRGIPVVVILTCTLLVSSAAFAGRHLAQARAIRRQLMSKDPAQQKQAIETIRQAMDKDAGSVAGRLAYSWQKPLRHLHRSKELAEWDLKALCADADPPLNQEQTEFLAEGRVHALLLLGRNDEALSGAKSLFNVIRMKRTAVAIQLIKRCLAADPQTASLMDKFEAEQKAGAKPTTQPMTSSVLKSIKVDAALYEKAIAADKGDTYGSLMRRGDRLLMADRADEALKAFGAAYQIANKRQLPRAIESIARAMRAQDGTIGRANAFLLAHFLHTAINQPAAGNAAAR